MKDVSHCCHMKDRDWHRCGPAGAHTPAELSVGLRYQDTNGLRVEGNAPFRTGWGAEDAEIQ